MIVKFDNILKTLLILVPLVAIFVVGGIGIYFSAIPIESDEIIHHTERWLVEYDMISFPKDKLEKMFSGTTTIYDEKFKIIKIESAFDYKNNLPHPLQV